MLLVTSLCGSSIFRKKSAPALDPGWVLRLQTWQKVAPMADTAARLFYDRLFEIDATTRPLFKTTNPAEQCRKLIQALTVVVIIWRRLFRPSQI